MPEFIDGLPLHPLIVHAVVVLLPLAALGAIVVAVWPAARRRIGWLVVAGAAVATALVPFATESGENLKNRVGTSEQINRHQQLGDQLLWFALPMLAAVLALMLVHTFGPESWAKAGVIVAAVLAVGTAVAASVHVYRVGEAGSRSVWEGVEDLPPASSDAVDGG